VSAAPGYAIDSIPLPVSYFLNRFFPPKHIRNVGTFQDAGPLENDPLVSARSEVAAIFPSAKKPDFVVSLGTGEPALSNDIPTDTSQGIWRNGAVPRLCRLFWEKMRDKKVGQAFQGHPRYHRLNIEFEGVEPRLDDVQSIPQLKAKARDDDSLSEAIDKIARSMIASLFYFKLDGLPERYNQKYVGTGRILCSIRPKDPAFLELFGQLSKTSSHFLLDGNPIFHTGDASCFNQDGNFRGLININTTNKFAISLKQRDSEPYNISGSPFSVDKLISAERLDASFGRPDHRKRKASDVFDNSRRKRRRMV
jgi:hypothetical protein